MRKVPPFNKVKEGRGEPILLPDLPIIDSHHHLFDRPHLRYMLDDYLGDVNAGHNIIGSVYIETQAFARPDGPEELRPVGEVEFASGVAAIMKSGVYGPCRVAAAMVGFADTKLVPTFGCGRMRQETPERTNSWLPPSLLDQLRRHTAWPSITTMRSPGITVNRHRHTRA